MNVNYLEKKITVTISQLFLSLFLVILVILSCCLHMSFETVAILSFALTLYIAQIFLVFMSLLLIIRPSSNDHMEMFLNLPNHFCIIGFPELA